MNKQEPKQSKFQKIYEAMPKEMQEKMNNQMEKMQEKAKKNPAIAKMLEEGNNTKEIKNNQKNTGTNNE